MDWLSTIEWNCNGIHVDLCVSSLCRITVNCHASMGMSATGNSSHSSSAIWVRLRLLPPCFPVLLNSVSTVPFGIVDLWNCFHFGLQKKTLRVLALPGMPIGLRHCPVCPCSSNHWLTWLSTNHPSTIANWNFRHKNWDSLRTPYRALKPFCHLGCLHVCAISEMSIALFVPDPL